MSQEPLDLLPGISEYLEQVDNDKSVNIKNLEEIVYRVNASTGIGLEASAVIVKLFFSEIRNGMLRGDVIVLAGLGKFSLSSPKKSKNKKRIFPKFKAYNSLIDRMNK